jgi:AAA domain/Toprim-like
MSVAWSPSALRYFEEHAINPKVAATVGVRESGGELVYLIKPRDGEPIERTRRPQPGKERTYQPGGVELVLWWPLGIPMAGDPNSEAPWALINEGESDLLAGLSVLTSRNGNERARHFLAHSDLTLAAIPGTGYPVDRLVRELQAAGTREAYLGFDADEPGDKYAAEASEALHGVGIKTMRLPISEGRDLADELAAAEDPTYALADLIALAEVEDASDGVADFEPQACSDEDERNPASPGRWAVIDGASFALDVPERVPAVWGDGENVAWARDEPLGLVGPQGVGKTTITHLLALNLLGLGRDDDQHLLGLPVTPIEGNVLLLALDRPAQAARALHRVVTEDDREVLQERLLVRRGQLPFDLLTEPRALADMAVELGAGAVLIDAAKDTGLRLSTEEGGAAFNDMLQALVAAQVQVAFDHHQRKATSDNLRPKKLADVYGSMWVTAGCGSVLLLWGEPGDPVVELRHLKQPAEEIGPLAVVYDQRRGTATVDEGGHDRMIDVVRERGGSVSVREAAVVFFGVSDPDSNQIEKARRKLEALAAEGTLVRVDEDTKFGNRATYREAEK